MSPIYVRVGLEQRSPYNQIMLMVTDENPVGGSTHGVRNKENAASKAKWLFLVGTLVVMLLFNIIATTIAIRSSAALHEERLGQSGRLYYGEYLSELTTVTSASA